MHEKNERSTKNEEVSKKQESNFNGLGSKRNQSIASHSPSIEDLSSQTTHHYLTKL